MLTSLDLDLVDSAVEPKLSELVQRVEGGDEITILRGGAAVAKLVPIGKSGGRDERAEAVQRIQKLGATLSLGGLGIKNLIAEGRK